MKKEANRNAHKLSRNNPSMIKELRQYRPPDLVVILDELTGVAAIELHSSALDVALSVLYCLDT